MEIVLSIIGTLCVCYLLHRLSIKKHGVENDTGVAGSCASEHEEKEKKGGEEMKTKIRKK